MQGVTSVTDRSFEQAGLPKDFPSALAEFIWNGFDAKASKVEVNYKCNEVRGLEYLEIKDNGIGIDHETLQQTFGSFLDSQKRAQFARTSYIHGKKGRGRFSFQIFSPIAKWRTAYCKQKENFEYEIAIHSSDKTKFDYPDKPKKTELETGSTVFFDGFVGINQDDLESEALALFLKSEFGWFLELNKNRNYQLLINGQPLDYQSIIAETDSVQFKFEKDTIRENFKIHFIQWNELAGERFYYYFLDNEQKEKGKILTSFNNKGDGFLHSVYVQSDYFNNFALSDQGDAQGSLLEKNQSDDAFKELLSYLKNFLEQKRREFIKKSSDKLIERFQSEGVMPKFEDNKYGEEREKDFKQVVKEVYAVEPKIFNALGREQKTTLLRLFEIVIDSEQREAIMNIMADLVELSPQQREDLSNVLKKTHLSKVTKVLNLIESRYKTVMLLKALVFDLNKFTKERDHIQKVMEENFWILGDQFHLVTADKNFERALAAYLRILDEENISLTDDAIKISDPEKYRRMDIFLCGKRITPDHSFDDVNDEIEENIIVELKEARKIIDKKVYRQVEDYLGFIRRTPQFLGETRQWKFFIIGIDFDDFIKGQQKAFKSSGKRFLVNQVENYEMYVMKWDDLFRLFEAKHRYLLDKLEFDKEALEEELKLKNIDLSLESSDQVTDQILTTSDVR